jgi:hypothetical protein
MGEATDIEPLAVALHESYCRYVAQRLSTVSYSRSVIKQPGEDMRTVDWFSLTKDERDLWRERAKDMVREAR